MGEPLAQAIYLDSNVIILAWRGDGRGDEARRAIERAEQGEYVLVISTAVISEFLFWRELTPKQVDDFNRWTNSSHVVIVELSRSIAQIAGELGRKYGPSITPMDAIHVATALSKNVPVMLTQDGSHPTNKRRKPDGILALNQKLPVGMSKLQIVTAEEHDEQEKRRDFPLGDAAKS